MRTLFTLLLASALSFGNLYAQSSVWEVSNGERSVYLGGTCHLLRAKDYPLPVEFDMAYQAADSLVFEVDPNVLQDPAFATQLMAASIYKDGRTLQSVLSKEAYTALATAGSKANIPIDVMQNMKPGMAIMVVTLQQLMQAGVTQEGVDIHFGNLAQEDGKAITSLETAEFQLKLITELGEGIESELVLYSLKDLDQINKLFDEIINAWRSGDLDTINRLFVEDMAAFPEIYAGMLKERNDRWLPQIEAMLQTEPTEFVLVGVGHMPGKDGVIQLLKAKGYTVTQLRPL